jgi:hypothetical protein
MSEVVADMDGVPGPIVVGDGAFDEHPATRTVTATAIPTSEPMSQERRETRLLARSVQSVGLGRDGTVWRGASAGGSIRAPPPAAQQRGYRSALLCSADCAQHLTRTGGSPVRVVHTQVVHRQLLIHNSLEI